MAAPVVELPHLARTGVRSKAAGRTKLAVHCDSWWGVGLSEASDDEGMGDHDLVGAEGPGHE